MKFKDTKIYLFVNRTLMFLKKTRKVLLKFFALVSLLFFFVVPFMNNILSHNIAKILWFPSCLMVIISVIFDFAGKYEPVFDNYLTDKSRKLGEPVVLAIFISVFVHNFYKINTILAWAIFIAAAIYFPYMFLSILLADWKENQRSKEEKTTSSLNILKNIFLYWFLDITYISWFSKWEIPMFIFGVISVVIISINLCDVFLKGMKSIRILFAFELIALFVLSGYLIYAISDEKLQTIVLTIFSALVGGVLALLGVAWTIQNGEKHRQEDLQRIEDERIELERKKYIPYIKISSPTDSYSSIDANVYTWLNFEKSEDRTKCKNNVFHLVLIEEIFIKNISNSNIIVSGLYIDDKFFPFEKTIIEKQSVCCINTTKNCSIIMAEQIGRISLAVNDILNNRYEIECKFKIKIDNRGFISEVTKDEEKFVGYPYRYVITNADLPKLL